jgi:hypothetical protein
MTREYVGPVPDAEWRKLLTGALDRADEFRVHMPDGDGQLSYGRAEFMKLPAVKVRPWSGMRDAIEIVGPLTPAAKDLFSRLEVSIESFDPEHKLWDYELVANGTVVLPRPHGRGSRRAPSITCLRRSPGARICRCRCAPRSLLVTVGGRHLRRRAS